MIEAIKFYNYRIKKDLEPLVVFSIRSFYVLFFKFKFLLNSIISEKYFQDMVH